MHSSDSLAAGDVPLVRLEALSKRFVGTEGPVDALRDIHLEVSRGDRFGIIGRSGAGKSTLLRCLNRLERPDRGRVWIGGNDIGLFGAAELARLRRKAGMIFQHFNLLSSLTVYQNVALPLKLAGVPPAGQEDAVLPLLELVGLTGKREVYPSKLSGGQKQRVGIARALVHRPDLLLCDEATSALDPETTRSILALLRDLNRRLGLTIVLITHEMSVIRSLCRSVAVMDHGSIVEQGSVESVFSDPRSEVTRSFLFPDTPWYDVTGVG